MTAIDSMKENPIRIIITYNPVEDVSRATDKGIKVVSFEDLLSLGKDTSIVLQKPTPDVLASIMYTSGTTGEPKGVMLTHKNLMAAVSGYMRQDPPEVRDVSYVSYLPMAHMMERVSLGAVLYHGGKVGMYSGVRTKYNLTKRYRI
jgi:long-chain acyl-CoA synthetase